MSKKKTARRIFVADLKPGDIVETTTTIRVVEIENLDKTKPTISKGIVVIKGVPTEGGWRNQEGEFVISSDEQLRLVKRPDDDKSWLSVVAEWFGHTVPAVVAVAIAAVVVFHSGV